MQRPDEETLRAITSLDGNPNWERIKVWFYRSLHFAEKALSENTVFNAGRVAELSDLMEKISTASAALEEAKRAEK